MDSRQIQVLCVCVHDIILMEREDEDILEKDVFLEQSAAAAMNDAF